ncbi:2-oxoacid:acceptor oxidoreductase subunit alpha [Tumebacillus permanentifrigoris]|uniref:2-oxoglutarate ferredoxin oxidoreductase subunit alpha n=1 Tax=Tumebacillus permanentifrigoris TaxID=378543 RepID=A0A316D6X8_9BACL|nr:2-oxoacid:acceptor oxidoreductase subunit alpha [Tumebacillus permanentifrigoris]PWK11358.1 2-oxoglutarate ferredoxin oxidoreductase subunit alpha [Tumebacillus permanentifrigoris]
MSKDLGWKVGGAQGEGIESTGDIFALSLFRLGYYVSTYRHFMSLIKGGHTNGKVRVTTENKGHHGDDLHILLAFDQETINFNFHELVDGGFLIYDTSIKDATVPANDKVNIVPVPLTDIAKECGSTIMKNMVSIGATAAIIGLTPDDFRSVLTDRFGSKGDEVVEKNIEAMQKGFDFYKANFNNYIELPARPVLKPDRLFISGNEATSIGAIAGGARFLSQYPITPATEVMYQMVKNFPKLGGAVVQAEDEIAAVMMAIGANYTGARALTATSGPGFSLMMEALGLAGISETPLVIVDVMRAGPSTGLPTKTEQSDLFTMMYGSHGEIPRIVLTPRNVEEVFYMTKEAFNLAEKYQCPVIVATDLFMGMNKWTVESIDFDKLQNTRGNFASQEYLDSLEKGEFKRFDVSVENGVSLRTIPGMKNGRFVAMGNESDEVGVEMEEAELRVKQMDKRAKKLVGFDDIVGASYVGAENAELLLVDFGSTSGIQREVYDALVAEGVSVGHLSLARVLPFPTVDVAPYINAAKKILVTELNSTGQLASQLKQYVGGHEKYESFLKYSGDPLLVREVLAKAKDVAASLKKEVTL